MSVDQNQICWWTLAANSKHQLVSRSNDKTWGEIMRLSWLPHNTSVFMNVAEAFKEIYIYLVLLNDFLKGLYFGLKLACNSSQKQNNLK
jgi:hypothetical protein